MTSNVNKFKHFEIDASKQEKLIEMWKYFHPKDEPVPVSAYAIRINDQDVANHVFMEVLKYDVYEESCVRIDRWQVRTQNILVADPVDLMYERFIEVKSGGVYKPKKVVQEKEDEEPAKKRKK